MPGGQADQAGRQLFAQGDPSCLTI